MAFIDTLIAMRNGGAAIELEQALEEVVKAVRKTGKTGKLTLTVQVQPADKGPDIDTVFLQDKVKIDAPKPDKKLTLFFANESNQLTRNDTRQFNMLDEVEPIEVKGQTTNDRR
jgi:hypothetical protein